MLTARAVTQVARQGAPDALYGVSHTTDEVTFSVPAAQQLHQQRVTAAEILGQDVVDAETIDEQTGEVHEAEVVDEPEPQPDLTGDWPEVAPIGGQS